MKILFISHDAYRAGAQILLLHFLEWIKEYRPNVQVDVVLIKGGELENRFEQVSRNVYLFSSFKEQGVGLREKIVNILKAKKTKSKLYKTLKNEHYNQIYANSVVSLSLGATLKEQLNCKLLLHVHELESVIQDREPQFKKYSPTVDRFIAASKLVKNNLITNHGLNSGCIKVIYEFSKLKTIETAPAIKNNTFVVGGCGSISHRKGYDLFIELAKVCNDMVPNLNIKFLWVGGDANTKKMALKQLSELGLNNKVEFVGGQENPYSFFKLFDVFLLTSREDPFPLVCIEAGQMGIPIICFKNFTGTAEVLHEGGGKILENEPLSIAACAIIDYYNNPASLKKDGKKAQAIFKEFTPEMVCPQLFKEIEALLHIQRND